MIELQPQSTGLLAVYPKPRRTFRMKQPTKDELRRQLEVERTENQRLRCVLQAQRPAWQIVVFGAVLGIGLSALAWCLA